jgi:hypothetical protein
MKCIFVVRSFVMRMPTRLVGRDQPGERICQLCFGSPIARRQIPHPEYTDTICDFLPGQVFGVIWWKRDLDDRQHRTVAVLEAIPSARTGFSIPDLSTDVLVHAILDQHGPAGTGGGWIGFCCSSSKFVRRVGILLMYRL